MRSETVENQVFSFKALGAGQARSVRLAMDSAKRQQLKETPGFLFGGQRAGVVVGVIVSEVSR